MRTIQIRAEQGHRVPDRVIEARGPFGKYEPEILRDEPDNTPFPPGATAQNGMTEVPRYQCRTCGSVVSEHFVDDHRCEE